jgi:hypothetical protein
MTVYELARSSWGDSDDAADSVCDRGGAAVKEVTDLIGLLAILGFWAFVIYRVTQDDEK